MKRVAFYSPIVVFTALTALFAIGLQKEADPSDARYMDRPLPAVSLAPLYPRHRGLRDETFKGKVVLMNVFGSWCVACGIEHPLLMQIAAAGELPLIGINWRDRTEDARAWLERHGNPYTAIGVDPNSAFVTGLGVTGAPETFIVDHRGRLRYRYRGPLTPIVWNGEIWPLVTRLQQEAAISDSTEVN